ncbi:MAG: cytochrome-c oxidase, cbb3-type subunit III [Pseudomonadota bacterium]
MSVGERDPHTGLYTTGHEWAGIKELDTPIPKAVKFFYALTFAVALLMWILLPTWPLWSTYTKGLLGFSQRDFVAEQLAVAAAERQDWSDRILALDLSEPASDPEARAIALRTGATLFADNCAACHGHDAMGGPGFPDLTDGAWLWGGSAEDIHETLRVGINSDHDETRFGQMPAFGRDQILERADILALIATLQHLAGQKEADAETLAAGQALFADNCASCHGEEAMGDASLGAPNLTDGFWIYGGDRDSLYRTLYDGRQGHMPHWGDRLSPLQLKTLALYVESLGGQ